MRRVLRAITLVLCLISAPYAASAESYLVGPGDTMRVRIHEWPELSGEFVVAASGAIFVPLIGQVDAGGMTPMDLAAKISKVLKEKGDLADFPNATVEVVKYRPFFMMGEIQRPGAYEFQPQITVRKAVSLSGGFFRAVDETSTRLQLDVIRDRGTLRLLALKTDELAARKARLDAEHANSDKIDFPESLTSRKDDPEIATILDEERLLFEAHNKEYAEENLILGHLKDLYVAEIDATSGEIVTIEKLLKSATDELINLRGLVAKGLAPAPRLLAAERTQVGISSNRKQLETSLLRAKQNVRQTEHKILEAHNKRTFRILEERQRVEVELAEVSRKMDSAARLIRYAEGAAPVEQEMTGDPMSYFRFYRTRGDREREAIGPNEPILPGDVISVEQDPNSSFSTRLSMEGRATSDASR